MQEWMVSLVEQWGYPGVLLLIAAENLFPPIPSEIILTFAGFLTTRSGLNLFGVVFHATAGSVLGAFLLYRLGHVLGRSRVQTLVRRHGRLLQVHPSDIDRAYGWFERYQGKTVFFCRMVPLIRSLISIPAGMAGMPMGSFLLLTALGSAVWNTLLALAGALLGDAWEDVVHFVNLYSTAVVAVLAAVCAGLFLFWMVRRLRRRPAP